MIKNLFAFTCILCSLFFWTICPSQKVFAEKKNFNVLTSTFPIYLFTANICASVPGVEVKLLVPAAAGCPHDFALRPQDMQKLTRASVLIINGASLEDFLAQPLKNIAPGLPVIDSSHGITLLDSKDEHVNGHIFAAPMYAVLMVRNIAEGLKNYDPANAARYEQNARDFCEELEQLSNDLSLVGKKATNKKIALEHDALAYMAVNANLTIVSIFENEVSAAQLARIQKQLVKDKPVCLAGDSQYSDKMLKTLSEETQIPFIMLDPCASGPENPALDYYQKVMQKNINTLGGQFDK